MFENKKFIALTALWAFVESGLGALLHALHLPFTGIVLGGFSVIIISLLAIHCKSPFKEILQATLVVLAMKFAANPATSPMAFIAVGFQGLLGGIIFSISKHHLLATILFGTLAMLESALQKLLIVTLVGGKSFWTGLDKFFESVCKTFHVSTDSNFSIIIVVSYTLLFFIWGIVLGIWMYKLPKQIEKRIDWYKNIEIDSMETNGAKNKKTNYALLSLIVLFVLSFLFTFQNNFAEGLRMLIRTAGIIAIWLWVVLPFWKKIMQNKSSLKSQNYNTVENIVPLINNSSKALYKEVSRKYSGIKKWKEYVLALIVYSLNLNNE